VKNVYEVLHQKELDIRRVRKEIKALRFVIRLLAEDDADWLEQGVVVPSSSVEGRPAPCAAFRCLVIHQHEPARQRAQQLVSTPAFAKAQRQRKKVEALFAERLRRMKFVREQFFLAAAAQNIKRLVRFLSPPTAPQALTA
jgi:hypothetical protein